MIDSQYQTALVKAFRDLYRCDAEHVETVRVVQAANWQALLPDAKSIQLHAVRTSCKASSYSNFGLSLADVRKELVILAP